MFDSLFLLLGLVALFLVVAAPIALGLALAARSRAREALARLADVDARLRALERARDLAATPKPQETPAPPPAPHPTTPPAEAIAASPQPATPPRLDQPPVDVAAREAPVLSPPIQRRGLEERLGTSWTVWVGGAALALGAILLVRYSIEQGFFGPGARIVMGVALAILLIAIGEWLRRRETPDGAATAATAHIPGVLTATGAIAGFGAIYAAHAVYGFIGPAVAFVALGVVGVVCMFAAALHGPALAGLGLVGALATPLLVSSRTPSPWPVVLYLAVVAIAAYALARLRRWLWLAIATGAGAGLWAIVIALGDSVFMQAAMLHVALQTALACFFFAWQPHYSAADERPDAIATLAPSLFGLCALVVLAMAGDDISALWIFCASVTAIALAATGFLVAPATACVAASGAFIVGALAIWPDAIGAAPAIVDDSAWAAWRLPPAQPAAFAAFGMVAAAALGAGSVRALIANMRQNIINVALVAGAGAATPVLALILAWLRMGRIDADFTLAAIAAGLGVIFVTVAALFQRAPQSPPLALGAAASGAIAALALGFVFAFSGGTLTIALALSALGTAYVSTRLDIAALRWCVAALGIAIAARLAWEPRIIGGALSPTPIFNWLLVGYGVPALAFGWAARAMRLHGGEDTPVRIAQSLAILLSGFLVIFEIRHALNGGDIYAERTGLVEQGLNAVSAFGFAVVLTRLNIARRSLVFHWASLGFGALAMLLTLFALLLAANPFWTDEPIAGGVLFNDLLIGYAAPALAACALSIVAASSRPRWYVMGARACASVLAFATLSLGVRHAFQGPYIDYSHAYSEAELYTYSAVWLLFGLALLAWGLWRGSAEARVASALLIVATALKVFIFDLAGLEGLWRAMSFIGLGAVLIGIGLVYQKIVFAPRRTGDNPAEPPAPA